MEIKGVWWFGMNWYDIHSSFWILGIPGFINIHSSNPENQKNIWNSGAMEKYITRMLLPLCTLPETNIVPETHWSEDEIPFWNGLIFSCNFLVWERVIASNATFICPPENKYYYIKHYSRSMRSPSLRFLHRRSSSSVASTTAWQSSQQKPWMRCCATTCKKHLEVGMIFQKPFENDDIFHKDRSIRDGSKVFMFFEKCNFWK